MLIKLFAMRMVANNFLLFSSNPTIAVFFRESSLVSKSDFEREKNAISDPEISADKTNNKTKVIEPETIIQSILLLKNILVGSESKDK